jgi:hypothetical protein
MNVNVGAVYSPATSPFAVFGAEFKQVSRVVNTALPFASLTGACGVHRDRTATRTVRVGWLNRPAGALVARKRARWGWAPVFWVVMPPPIGVTPSACSGPLFSPVIANGVAHLLRTAPVVGLTSVR